MKKLLKNIASSRSVRARLRDGDPSDEVRESSSDIRTKPASDSGSSGGDGGVSSTSRIDEQLLMSAEMAGIIGGSESEPEGRTSSEAI